MASKTIQQINEDYARAGSDIRVNTTIQPMKPISVAAVLIAIIIRLAPWVTVAIIVVRFYVAWQP